MDNTPNLEQEIADIERRLAEKKVERETQGQPAVESEILHEAVGDKIREALPTGAGAAPAPVVAAPVLPSATTPIDTDQPAYNQPELQTRVQELVNVTFTKGLPEAVKEITNDPNKALLDAFHAALVEQLREEMIKQGKLKNL